MRVKPRPARLPPGPRAPILLAPADAFSVRNTLRDSNIAGKIDAADKERLEKAVEETVEWMDHNQVGGQMEFIVSS